MGSPGVQPPCLCPASCGPAPPEQPGAGHARWRSSKGHSLPGEDEDLQLAGALDRTRGGREEGSLQLVTEGSAPRAFALGSGDRVGVPVTGWVGVSLQI